MRKFLPFVFTLFLFIFMSNMLGMFPGFGPVHPPIAWLKLRALAEGAAIASRRLWGLAA